MTRSRSWRPREALRLFALWGVLAAVSPSALSALAPSAAEAQVIAEPPPPPFPDPKKFSRGLFVQGELGAIVYLGRAYRYAGPGVLFGARLGYDVLRWLAVQVHVAGSASSAQLPPPTIGQTFQTFLYAGELRLALDVRRVRLFLEGGAGAMQISTNILDLVKVTGGSHFSLAVVGGLGAELHTLNRHFSLGVQVDYTWLQGWTRSHALLTTAHLKYTH